MAHVLNAWRSIVRRPRFAIGVIVMLAVGLGFNTALYAVVESALLRPLPYRDASRVVFLWYGLEADGTGFVNSYADFEAFKARSRAFEALTTYNISFGPLLEGDLPDQINGTRVSAEYFTVVGVQPVLGRALAAGDELVTEATPIVIAYSLWTRRFGADPGIVDRLINFGGRTRRVVGVMPAEFRHPEPFWSHDAEFWTPMTVTDEMRDQRGFRYLRVLGRLAPGVTLEAARADVERISAQLMAEFPRFHERGHVIRPVFDELVGDTRPLLLVFFGAVILVLTLVVVNIVNLLLAQASARRTELTIRAALGASRARLAMQLILESVFLGAAGGLLGLIIAASTIRLLMVSGGARLDRLESVSIDGSVIAFAVALSVITGFICGLLPARRVARAGLSSYLASSRTSTALDASRLRHWLIAGEMALAVPLLVGAVLLGMTLVNLLRVDPGFETDRAVHFRITLPTQAGQRYEAAVTRIGFIDQLTSSFRAVPGVSHAGVVSSLPMGGLNNTGGELTYERPGGGTETTSSGYRAASAGYFPALGIPLRQGRLYTDDAPDEFTAVVNERLASQLFGGASPIGRRIRVGDQAPWRTIVGVVGSVRHVGLTASPAPEVFWPYRSDPWTTVSVVVRATSGEVGGLAGAVRPTVRELDPQLPIVELATVGQVIARTRSTSTLAAASAGLFSGLGLLLAAFGTFAVLSLLVHQRMREIGVRIALGATPASVGNLILRQSMLPAVIGCAAGGLVAVWLARALSAMLFGIEARDPRVFATAIGVLLLTAAVASIWPAVRAMRVDPIRTLRE